MTATPIPATSNPATPLPAAAAATGSEAEAAREALLRAVPLTRMVDYGLDLGAALRITAAARSGVEFDVACEAEADALLALALEVSRAGRTALLRGAMAALVVAQLAFGGDVPRKRELYARLTAVVDDLAGEPDAGCFRVAIPYAGAALSAILVRPPADSRGTVIVFGGLNGWGAAYWGLADSLAGHGLATVLLELPGQGITRMEGGLYADGAIAAAVSATVDWIEADDSLDGRTGVCGNSFGGLFAALAAADDERLAAVVVNGAPATPELLPFRTLRELMFAVFGTTDEATVIATLAELDFTARPRRIAGAVLVVNGGRDPIASAAGQRPFADAAGPQARWLDFPDGEHTLYNHAPERNAVVSQFFADNLRTVDA